VSRRRLLPWSVAIMNKAYLLPMPSMVPPRTTQTGSAYLYYLNDADSWSFSERVLYEGPGGSSGNKYGSSVSISTDSMVVGVPENDVGASDAGSVFLYSIVTEEC
jgi:hypothetical protein